MNQATLHDLNPAAGFAARLIQQAVAALILRTEHRGYAGEVDTEVWKSMKTTYLAISKDGVDIARAQWDNDAATPDVVVRYGEQVNEDTALYLNTFLISLGAGKVVLRGGGMWLGGRSLNIWVRVTVPPPKPKPKTKPFDVVGFMMSYEMGECSDTQMIEGFQELLNSGIVWRLQGHYGRTARALLEDGLISTPQESS